MHLFLWFREVNLNLKPKKYSLLKLEVPFMGPVISRESIKPDPAKTEKVRNHPRPMDVANFWALLRTTDDLFQGLPQWLPHYISGLRRKSFSNGLQNMKEPFHV